METHLSPHSESWKAPRPNGAFSFLPHYRIFQRHKSPSMVYCELRVLHGIKRAVYLKVSALFFFSRLQFWFCYIGLVSVDDLLCGGRKAPCF